MPYGNKEFFSEDVIQRIASGNEPTQTLISLDMLENVMNSYEMRNVLGGCGTTCCCYEDFDGYGYFICGVCAGPSAAECETYKCPPGFPYGPIC